MILQYLAWDCYAVFSVSFQWTALDCHQAIVSAQYIVREMTDCDPLYADIMTLK